MGKNEIISLLEKVGLSNYEARAYQAALSQPLLTGYKLSQLSGVPRSRIYETIEKVISKGLLVFQSAEKIKEDKNEYTTSQGKGLIQITLPLFSYLHVQNNQIEEQGDGFKRDNPFYAVTSMI